MAKKSGTSANDELIGGNGDDRLYGKGGDDLLSGGAGDDFLSSGKGDDQLIGGAGNDRLDAACGDDVLEGGAGNDELLGRHGDDRLDGGAGNDRLWGGDGNDRLWGGDGNDDLSGGAGHDRFWGGDGDDLLEGGDDDDRLDGQAGHDHLVGGDGDDRLYGKDGDDLLSGGDGDDFLSSGKGDDQLIGGAGNDRLDADAGDDVLEGDAGNDELLGRHGDDRLDGGAGNDWLHGGKGDDLFVYRTGAGNDEVIGDSGSDTIRLEVDDGWVLNLTKGKTVSDEDGQLQLSKSAAGTITLADGSTIRFRDIERIEAVADEPDDDDQPSIGLELVAEPVDENAPDGSIVGTAVTTAPAAAAALAGAGDAGTGLTYSLTDDAGGRFAIDPGTGVVTVADGAVLDYESATQHSIEVTVTDAGGHSTSQTFTIAVADVNEAPSIGGLDSSEVAEDAAAGTVVGTVGASDPDAGDTLTYSLTDDAGGRFAIDPDTGVITVASPKPDAPPEPVASWALDSSLDGQDQKVVIGHDSRFELDQGTVSVRFTADHVSGKQELFSKDSLQFDDGGHLSVWLDNGQVIARLQSDSESYHLHSAPGAVSAAEPTQVAVSFGDEGFRLYVGGELVDQSSYTGGIADNREPLVVGADAKRSGDGTADNLSHFFAGTIHDLAVYDQQMGAEQPPVADAAPDAVSAAEHSIEVTVTDAGGLSASRSFTITVTDLNEAPSIGALDSSEVAESAAANTVVGTVGASDPDGDTLTYALTDDAGGRFAIDPDTGVITVADGAGLDYESATQHGIEVTVTDAGGHSTSQTFTIAVADVNEAPSIGGLDSSEVAEDAAAGTVVGTVGASDPDGDTLTYALTDDAGGRFAIDPDTGVISVADSAALDHESAAQHDITVEVTDAGGHSASQTFTIAVANVNEAPGSLALSAGEVAENAAEGTVVGTVGASEPDAGDALSYALSDDAGGRFAIDPDTGVITVASGAALDHESASQHNIEVTVTDAGGLRATRSFAVAVTDVNEAPSIAGLDSSEVAEDASGGTVVGTIGASDPDAGDALSYALSDDAGGRFAIDPDSGVITVADGASFDHDAAAQHSIEVEVTDADGLSTTRSFTIDVIDVNQAPAIVGLSASEVPEAALSGTVVGTVSASDPNPDDALTYFLSNDADGRFAIDSETGVITVADATLLDHESAAQHDIEVEVTDSDGLSTTRTFTIAVGDVNETPSIAGLDSGEVAENASEGMVVGTVGASDPDAGDALTFTLTDDADGRFAIDPDSGAISVASGAALDYENAMQHVIEVAVTDAGGLSATQTLGIDVTNVNEQPVIEALSSNEVIEGAADGTVVGSVSALDPDGTSALTYALTDDAGGRFAIDPDTGVISVADGSLLDYDEADQHGIEVTVTDPGGLSHVATYVIELRKDNSGDDTLVGGAGDDQLDGGPGHDTLDGFEGDDHLVGGSGSDLLNGGDGNDLLEGGAGNDFLFGNSQDDQLFGGLGNDQLFGSLGNDRLDGDAGSDELTGSSGNDVLNGGDGDDTVYGGRDDDVLAGGAGDDILFGGSGDLNGSGADRFVFASPDEGVDQILDFGADDVLAIGEMLAGFAEGEEAAFVKLVDDGTDTMVQVDVDGAANGEAWQSIAVLTEVNGVSLDDMVSAGQVDFWIS